MWDELLNSEVLYSLREAQILIEEWRNYYNTKKAPQCIGLQTTSRVNHYTDGSEANDALAIILGQSDEAAQHFSSSPF